MFSAHVVSNWIRVKLPLSTKILCTNIFNMEFSIIMINDYFAVMGRVIWSVKWWQPCTVGELLRFSPRHDCCGICCGICCVCFAGRGMRSAELSNLVTWLLSGCSSPESKARQQCMQTFTILAPPATSKNPAPLHIITYLHAHKHTLIRVCVCVCMFVCAEVANTMVWIRKTVESEGGGYFVSR